MNISDIIQYLYKEYGYDIDGSYYENILNWRHWWKGYYKPFHRYKEISGKMQTHRDMYTLKMAKKVCEDWASILLNEKTQIEIDDKSVQDYICGDDNNKGLLREINFWSQANELVEKAFYSGTGAFVVKINGMLTDGESIIKTKDAKIHIDYLTALNIVPLTVRNGRITEVAFASEVMEKGNKYTYLEMHTLENGMYKITNKYFETTNGKFIEKPLPSGIAAEINTGSSIPLFAIIKPNVVNIYDNSNGLGMAVFGKAIDNLKGVDLAYNNFNRDIKLGGKKVFYNDTIIQYDDDGTPITPDDIAQQLFVKIGDSDMDESKMVQEYNPLLRVQENTDAIQSQLDYFSFNCGLGTKHYQFNSGSVVTATQYMGDKQDLIQNSSKHMIIIEQALIDLVNAIVWVGREIIGLPLAEKFNVVINFEDGFIIDKEAEREKDLIEVRDGIMTKWEYRVKWYGDSEEEAKKIVGAEMTDDELMGFGGDE